MDRRVFFLSGPFSVSLFRVLKFLSAEQSAQNDFDSIALLWNVRKNDDDFTKTIKKGTALLLSLSLSDVV